MIPTVTLERREKQRFPIALNLTFTLFYRDSKITGAGKIVNMSSSGLLIETILSDWAKTYHAIHISIDWPVPLAEEVGLKLIIRGRVVRFGGGKLAVKCGSHEFRVKRAKTGIERAAGASA